MVAIVTVHSLDNSVAGGNVSVDSVLQGNPNGVIYPPTQRELPRILAVAEAWTGENYIIFTSANRGGACPSALFAYDPASQVATFVSQSDGPGPGGQIFLPSKVTNIPAKLDLTTLRTRLYPTGGVTYPVNTAEWFCPGP